MHYHDLFINSKRGILNLLVLVVTSGVWSATDVLGQKSEPFPFVFPASSVKRAGTAIDFSPLNSVPVSDAGFVHIRNGHFQNGRGRLRVWGVNLCFEANFPTHEDSEKLAARLASLGVNGVRIHHHETLLSPRGLYKSAQEMDTQQVDKLDYLLDQLHRRGIYANINLHVGRSVAQSLGLPPLGSSHSSKGDKHALHFMPQVQAAFWSYCRELLSHVNPYRKLARAEDPGIAMVEILNENRFSRDGAKYLRDAAPVYRKEIVKRWNAWLRQRYKNDERLRTDWQPKDSGPANVLADSHELKPVAADATGPIGGGWVIYDGSGQFPLRHSIDAAKGKIRIEPQKKAEEGWSQQLACEGLSLSKGERYTVSFEVRADSEKAINFNAATVTDGWKGLGLGGNVVAGVLWKRVDETFIATRTVDGEGRLAFDLGGNESAIELRNVTLQTGSNWAAAPKTQTLAAGTFDIPGASWGPVANDRFVEFMMDTERAFYRDTTKLLRTELGLKVPLCTTQTNYLGAKLAAELGDYTDLHSYWNHPLFQGKDWDESQWTVEHQPIAAHPYSNRWPRNSPLMRAAWARPWPAVHL